MKKDFSWNDQPIPPETIREFASIYEEATGVPFTCRSDQTLTFGVQQKEENSKLTKKEQKMSQIRVSKKTRGNGCGILVVVFLLVTAIAVFFVGRSAYQSYQIYRNLSPWCKKQPVLYTRDPNTNTCFAATYEGRSPKPIPCSKQILSFIKKCPISMGVRK